MWIERLHDSPRYCPDHLIKVIEVVLISFLTWRNVWLFRTKAHQYLCHPVRLVFCSFVKLLIFNNLGLNYYYNFSFHSICLIFLLSVEESPHFLITGLTMGVKATDVKNLCAHYGRVVSIKIVGNRQGTEPKIFAHVTMDSPVSASAAANHLNKYLFNGRIIEAKKVNVFSLQIYLWDMYDITCWRQHW